MAQVRYTLLFHNNLRVGIDLTLGQNGGKIPHHLAQGCQFSVNFFQLTVDMSSESC